MIWSTAGGGRRYPPGARSGVPRLRRGYASRVTIQKAAKSGRVSLHSADAKVKTIQISELDRVFGARGRVNGVGLAQEPSPAGAVRWG